MKNKSISLLLIVSFWSSLLTSTSVSVNEMNVAKPGSIQTNAETLEQAIVGRATHFMAENKKALVLLAVAVTLGLSLKYCSWVQGVVGIDTEDEIDDWRVFIQE